MLILPSVDQYRNDYTFLAPTSFVRDGVGNYTVIIRPRDQEVLLDGEPVAGRWRAAGPEHEWREVVITGGAHRAQSAARFGLLVVGAEFGRSYAYSAGSDLRDLVELR